MNTIYKLMCEKSPVQKYWNPRVGDNTNEGIIIQFRFELLKNLDGTIEKLSDVLVVKHSDDFYSSKRVFVKDLIWLPRQEDWQEMFINYRKNECESTDLVDQTSIFTDWCEVHNCLGINGKSGLWIPLQDNGDWTILWCLFVHDEVYGLVWDWDRNDWVKA